MSIGNATQILDRIFKCAIQAKNSVLKNDDMRNRVETVCRTQHASIRLLMSCLLGKLINPKVDPRKPYTEIQSDDCFSGRTLDEKYIGAFVSKYSLPCRSTTAFLTPVFRTMNRPLDTDIKLESRYRTSTYAAIQLLDDVAEDRIEADVLFVEVVRKLLEIRNETRQRMESLLKSLRGNSSKLVLSSVDTLCLIKQHLSCKNASRLPVLIVVAAYQSVGPKIGENVISLNSHTSADLQTGAFGDVEICLVNDEAIVTVYEMKMKKIQKSDIEIALEKIVKSENRINNYLFITTEVIAEEVAEYAARIYEETGGTEIAILDCYGFLEHFLHFFHRYRNDFLDAYQKLVLAEPDSSVSQSLKEAFLTLRRKAENDEIK